MPADVGVTLCVPEVACIPVQAPDAVQLEALVEDQVNVALDPKVIGVGLIDIATVDAAGGGGGGGAELLVLPHPAPFKTAINAQHK